MVGWAGGEDGDITTECFSSKYAPPDGLEGHTATAVGEGDKARIIVIGGIGMNGKLNTELHLLDLKTKRWGVCETWGKIPRPRWCHTASLVGGEIFIVHGVGDGLTTDVFALHVDRLQWREVETIGIQTPNPNTILNFNPNSNPNPNPNWRSRR